MRPHRSPTLVGLFAIVVIGALLEVLIRTGTISDQAMALPSEALAAIPRLFSEANLANAMLITMGMTATATGFAILFGVPLGWLLFRREILGQAYESWLTAAFSAPLILLYPLFLVLIGRSFATVIIMGFVPGIIPVIVQTRQGMLEVSRTLINVGLSFNASRWTLFRKILLPAATPSIFAGIRLGVMYTLVSIVGIEYLTDFGGLGKIVSSQHALYRIPETYAAILFVILVSMGFFWSFGRIERWLRPE